MPYLDTKSIFLPRFLPLTQTQATQLVALGVLEPIEKLSTWVGEWALCMNRVCTLYPWIKQLAPGWEEEMVYRVVCGNALTADALEQATELEIEEHHRALSL